MPRPTQPTLAAVVREQLGLSWNAARDLCRSGRVKIAGETERDPAVRVDAALVTTEINAPRETRGALGRDRILFLDAHVAVVNKLPGELTVPYKKERDTLVDQLRAAIRKRTKSKSQEIGVVHRLDKGTSGVLVFARHLASKRALSVQFREHTIERRYQAIAHGTVRPTSFETHLLADRGDGIRGSFGVFRKPQGDVPKEARWSRTHVRSVEMLQRASFVQLELETGRQHQIRIHLTEAGHPLVGERVYIRDFTAAGRRPIPAPRAMLHATSLSFFHPMSGEQMSFETPPPKDFRLALDALKPQ